MAEIRWTLQAADDLEAITDFIAADSVHFAKLFAINVLAAVERLEQFPGCGRPVPEYDVPAIRQILYGSYRIVYRSRNDVVEILTILHTRRLLDFSKILTD